MDKFWKGLLACNERGLEVSVMALIDQQRRDAYTLSVEQTPPRTDLAEGGLASGGVPSEEVVVTLADAQAGTLRGC